MSELVCSEVRCPRAAVLRYEWPRSGERYCCATCMAKVQQRAQAAGISVSFRSPSIAPPATPHFPELQKQLNDMYNAIDSLDWRLP